MLAHHDPDGNICSIISLKGDTNLAISWHTLMPPRGSYINASIFYEWMSRNGESSS